MKKILFLTRSFPDTRRSASMLCTHRVLESVALSGLYEVHVLSVRYPFEEKEEVLNTIHVHRFLPSIWERIVNLVRYRYDYTVIRRIDSLLRKIFSLPWYPLTHPFTAYFYSRTACKLFSLYNFDIVVSEHHEHESVLTGCHLKHTFPCVKHVALLWDPILGQIPSRYLPPFYARYCIQKMESFVSDNTTVIVSLSSMKQYYLNHGDNAKDKRIYLGIPGILPPDKGVRTEKIKCIKKEAINILYTGLLSPLQRNPVPIIELFNHTRYATNINLIFFASGARKEIEDASKSFKGTIMYNDYIPISEIHTLYHKVDYLLNISHVNANMVPSKIFEYMSYGKPIISVYTTEGDSAKSVLDYYPESLIVDIKKSNIDNVREIEVFLERKHYPIPFETVFSIFKENTPEAYLNVLNQL